MIDEVLSSTARVEGVPGGIDNGQNVGVDDQPPSQPEQVPEDKELEPLIYLELEGNP